MSNLAQLHLWKSRNKVVQTFPIFFVDLVVCRLVNDVEDVRTRKNRTSDQAQLPLKEPVQEHQFWVQSRLKILLKEKINKYFFLLICCHWWKIVKNAKVFIKYDFNHFLPFKSHRDRGYKINSILLKRKIFYNIFSISLKSC